MICASCGAEVEAAARECPKCEGPAVLAERYRLLSVLGRGANGITYRAVRTSDDKVFAVKEMPLRTLESVKAMELFDREARVLRQLDHRAVPRYEDDFVFGEGKNASLYLVQELVSGRTLDDELREKRYDAAGVFAIVAELAEVLEYLHRRSPPVVHRDVKPKNVMRRDDGRLVLIDFGSVRDALSMGGGSTVAGTFGYMAPEQLAGKATPASDVYGLGALAIQLLTRKEPDTLLGDDHRIDVRANVDASEAALVLLEEMLEPNAAKRLQRASDVRTRALVLARDPDIGARPAQSPKASPSPLRSLKASSPNPQKGETRRQRKQREREESAKKRAQREAVAAHARKREAKAARAEEAEQAEAAEKAFRTRDLAEVTNAEGLQTRNRRNAILVCAAVILVPAVGILAGIYSSPSRTTAVARTEPGVPELYARPIAVDVNGDGVEDMIVVSAIDSGPRSSQEDGEDTWGKANGHFAPFVQAIDGKDGHVVYSIEQEKAYTSLGNAAKDSERIVLVTHEDRLGVARVPARGKARLTVHDLATGKETKTLSFEESSGRACQNDGSSPKAPRGTFSFDRSGGLPGVVIDLERGTVVPASTTCGDVATSNVADVPADSITDRTVWTPRFSRETTLRAGIGPWGGRRVVPSAGLGVFIVDKNAPAPPPSGPTITMESGIGDSSGRDNGKVDVVGFDVAEGTTRFDRSLASLGFTTHVVDHVEGTEHGPLLFFTGSAGLALLDSGNGSKRWALALPSGHRVSSYTLSSVRAYLHVFGPDNSVYGFLSKKLGSRILVVDLATGTYVRSVPDGPLEPAHPPAKPTVDAAAFKAVVGCSCLVDQGTPLEYPTTVEERTEQRRLAMQRLEGKRPSGRDAGPTTTDAGVSSRIRLGMYTRSSVESGGHKRFGVMYSLDVDGKAFVLPHYDELREVIAPPRTLEGDVLLGAACDRDTVVFVADRVATAWSLSKQDELWTVELPVSRGEARTTLGGGASLSCTYGRIERDHVVIPSANVGAKDIVLKLADGSVVESDAGPPKAPKR